MKIECEKLNATVSERTCIVRHAKIARGDKHRFTMGEQVDMSLAHCATCEKGQRLYKEALKNGSVPAQRRKVFKKTATYMNHDYLQSTYGAAWV